MKKKQTKKGYVLALVIVITFILTVTVTSTFTLIMRYMIFAQKDLQNFAKPENVLYIEEETT